MKTGEETLPEPPVPEAVDQKMPEYPVEAWDGTLYGEYAKVATEGNYVPKELFIESMKTIVGAVTADRLKSSSGINARFYTILIAPSGTGKGTSITWTLSIFEDGWHGKELEKGILWSLSKDETRPLLKIGAQQAIFASEVGFYGAIERDPHTLVVAEELNTLVSPLRIQGSGDRLMTNFLNLKDGTKVQAGQSANRQSVPDTAYLSILAGGTLDIWESMFTGVKSDGTGLYNRFNIVGSENIDTVADLVKPDFSSIRGALMAKLSSLANAQVRVELSPEAKTLLNDWYGSPQVKNQPENVNKRINVIAIQNAMHIAWLLDNETIPEPNSETEQDAIRKITVTEDVMARAIKLADYEIAMRIVYAPLEGDNDQAAMENKVRKIVQRTKTISMRDLRRRVHSERSGTFIFNRALVGLQQSGEIQVAEPKLKYAKNGRTMIIWHGDGETE